MPRSHAIKFHIAAGLIVAAMPAGAHPSHDLESRRAALKKLVDEQWAFIMREQPDYATIVGDLSGNDRWSDPSIAAASRLNEASKQFLKRFEAIDTTGFPEQEKLNKTLEIQALKDGIDAYKLNLYLMPVDQYGGIQIELPMFATLVPFDSVKHYEDYLKRLQAIPGLLEQYVGVLEEGKRRRMMPPKFLMPAVLKQCADIAAVAGDKSSFYPQSGFPEAISVPDRTRLHDDLVKAIDEGVRPAYIKFATYLEKDYMPFAREQPGVWSLPNGDKIYRESIWSQTTTHMSPESLHQLGLKEVERIHGEMLHIAQGFGFADRKTFQASLKTNPKLFVATREEYLNLYRKYIAQMEPELPKFFGILPKTKVTVRMVEPYREEKASAAQYIQGSPDGSRSGMVEVNTGDLSHRSTLTVESTTYHESIPGHHLQISIAQQLPELPIFRQQASYTAYVEGWALYCEGLGKEIGFYKDPFSEYGRLTDELLRACRLVLDTGVHYKKWSREQMVTFFRENSNEDEPNIQAETDRYIAVPAQALAYKVGQLDILRLREEAKSKLGPKFDIRAFHDQILGAGSLPLAALDRRIENWIEAQQK